MTTFLCTNMLTLRHTSSTNIVIPLKKLSFDLQNYIASQFNVFHKRNHTLHIILCDLPHFRLFFASISMVLRTYFQQWTLKQKWTPWKQPCPCWSRVVQSQWQKFRRSPLHTHVVMHYDVKVPQDCLKTALLGSFVIRNSGPIFIYTYTGVVRSFANSPVIRSWYQASRSCLLCHPILIYLWKVYSMYDMYDMKVHIN